MKNHFVICDLFGFCVLSFVISQFSGRARAQDLSSSSWQFRWKQGQVLNYRIEHVTKATETTGTTKVERTEVASRLNIVKRWQVQSVDANGIATLQMSITAMRNEQIRPNGDVLLFDSIAPEKSTPGLREQMERYIGKPLAGLRVDRYGKVVEVLKGSATQFESDPPLVLRLPPETPVASRPWERVYQVTLDPPYGTGEKYDGTQRYSLAKIADGLATIEIATTLKLPENVAERIPLLQKQPAGQVVFNVRAGRIENVHLQVDQTVAGHQGPNSSYRFQSTYREQYTP
jgi:hypothetical protein